MPPPGTVKLGRVSLGGASEVTSETMRQRSLRFGREFTNRIRRRAPGRGDKCHLDEVVITIAGEEALALAGGRPGGLCSRRPRPEPARQEGRQNARQPHRSCDRPERVTTPARVMLELTCRDAKDKP